MFGNLSPQRHSRVSGVFRRFRASLSGARLSTLTHPMCDFLFFVVVCKTLNNLSADSHEKDDLPDGIYSTFSDWLTDMATANPRKTKIGEIRLF